MITPYIYESRDTMVIAYISADEVNRDLAVRIGETCGAQVQLLGAGDAPREGHFGAVLYDLESIRVRSER